MAVHPNCSIICVAGGKGGVGKSIVAANLAAAFATELRQQTLLIDFDSQSCGDQNVILGMREVKTLADLCNFTGAISAQTLNQVLNLHQPTGMGFIAAVKGREDSININVEVAMKQIETLSSVYKYIVIDLGNQIGPMQMTVLERATLLLMVTTPEVLAVTQTMKLVTDLFGASLPTDMLHVIVNKMSASGLAPTAIAATLKRPVLAAIPQDDMIVMGSIQRSTPFVLTAPRSAISQSYSEIVRKLTGGLLTQLKASTKSGALRFKKDATPAADPNAGGSRFKSTLTNLDPRTQLKVNTHNELIRTMDLKKNAADTQGDPQKELELRKKVNAQIGAIVDKESAGLARDERAQITKEILDEALGLGPLEDLLEDPAVTEIMVNGYSKIYIEKKGLVQLSPVTFTSNFHLRKVIERIVSPLGRQINESSPYVDARLKDGSRVNAIIEPLSIDGPAVTIRKFRKTPVTPDTYVHEYKAASANMMEFLKICVQNKLNVVISGGTGSGKTTLLNTLSGYIPSNERVVTIEDAAELQLKQDHVVRLESRPANMEGGGAVTIRDLVKNSLRMRPERIVVGECRDGAALDMLQAMSTGHDGSMTTVHANNPREALGRMETLCMMAGMELPLKAIREQIAAAINLIVQIQRLSDGTRKLISITEVQGMQGEIVTQQEVFAFKEQGFDKNRKIIGMFYATGLIPKFIEKMERKGLVIPKTLFSNDMAAPAPKPAPTPGPGNARPASGPGASSGTAPAQGTQAAADLKKASGGGSR
jgi:pilus assembly protein CpaF